MISVRPFARSSAASSSIARQARGVHRRHVPQAQHHDRRQRVDLRGNVVQLRGRSEQERPVDAEDRHVIRNHLVLQAVRAAGLDVLRRHPRHRRGPRDAPDEEQRGQHHPDLDGHRQIGQDGQRERRQPDDHVGVGLLENLADLPPLAHVPGDHEENGGEHRHRHVRRPARAEQQHGQQREGVDDARTPATARPSGCWSPCARARRSPAGRQRAATRRWRRPGRTARCWGCGDRRPCDRRRPPRAAIRWRRASPRSGPATAASAPGSDERPESENAGKPEGMPPNREPIVATSSCSTAAARVPANNATM